MRNITKIKRSIRAISPVISVLLMIAIAVVASLVAYAWVMGYMNFQTARTGQAIQIPSYAPGTDTSHMIIYVQNVGQGTIEVGNVYINDAQATITEPADLTIGEGQTKGITIQLPNSATWNPGEQIEIKVVTTTGTSMEARGTGTSNNNQNPGTDTYTLTITTPTGSGSIVANPSKTAYTSGEIVQLSANPVSGWAFSTWGGDLTGSTANPISITMDSNKVVTATFTEIPPEQFALTTSIEGMGSITKNPDQATYTAGTSVEITATPADGWTFDHWSGDLTGSANPATIVMNGAKSVTAVFTQNEYTLEVTTAGTGSGTVAKSPDEATYHYGDVVQLTANPVAGSAFIQWGGDLSGSTNPETITINGNKAVSATFNTEVATKLVFTVHPTNMIPNVNTLFTVERQSEAGNPITTGGAITVTLNDADNYWGSFYRNVGDSYPNTISSITIPAGSSSVNFYYNYYYLGGVPATITISGSYTGLTTATATVQVVNPTIVTRSPTVNGGGGWDNENNAYSDGSNYATSNRDDEQCAYSGYGFTITSGATITQVRVRLDAWVASAGGGESRDDMVLQVSADGGSTWLATTSTYNLPSSDANSYFVDVTSWTTWTTDKINGDMIWVRVTHDQTGSQDEDIYLDWIPIEVSYIL